MPDIPAIMTHSEVVEAAFSARKVILFCGSGVSQFAPTSLPTGQELRDDLLASVAASFEATGHRDPGISRLGSLPLEFLLGLFSRQQPENRLRPLMDSIAQYLAAAVPNRIHLLAAILLTARPRTYIITTNYDTGLERALNAVSDHVSSPVPPNSVTVYPLRHLALAPSFAANAIYKIHGCALRDNPEDLVLTTTQESTGLPPPFLSILPNLFKDSLVIFMGYSASEPDCIEALLEVGDFDAIWVARDQDAYVGNPRAHVIMSAARTPRVAVDLLPLLQQSAHELHARLLSPYACLLDIPALTNPDMSLRGPLVNPGLALFRQFASLPSVDSMLHSLIEAFLWARDFRAVETLLAIYRERPFSSRYWFLYWTASITRDQNQDWAKARDLFKEATKTAPSKLEASSAEVERLGLDTLLSQADQEAVRSTESQIRQLAHSLQEEVARASPSQRVSWLRLLGLAQKMLVQNLTYQTITDRSAIEEALLLSEEATGNLLNSRDLNARIETQRFGARAHLRAFFATGDQSHLTAALSITRRVQLLFSLLGMTMGTVNSKRQYALLLCLARRVDEAYSELRYLNNLLRGSPDKLSRLKVAGLELLLASRDSQFWRLPAAAIKFIGLSRYYSPSQPFWRNVISAFVWLRSFSTGHAG